MEKKKKTIQKTAVKNVKRTKETKEKIESKKKPIDKIGEINKSSKKTSKKIQPPKIDTAVILNPEKQDIISKFQIKDGDTGSPEVQIALLTNRIEKLVSHLKSNPQDNHSRRGLLGIVSKRRRLLHYLEKKDNERYKDVAKKIGLAK